MDLTPRPLSVRGEGEETALGRGNRWARGKRPYGCLIDVRLVLGCFSKKSRGLGGCAVGQGERISVVLTMVVFRGSLIRMA